MAKKKANEIIKGKAVLTDPDIFAAFVVELRATEEFKHTHIVVMEAQRRQAVDWLDSLEKKKKNYRAFFRNWLRKDREKNPGKYGGESTGKQMVY